MANPSVPGVHPIMGKNILVALPTMAHLHVSLAMKIVGWAKKYPRGTMSFYATAKVSPVDRARNQCVEYFLANPAFTHLMFIDSDTIPPEDAIDKLIAVDAPIVSGLTPIVHYDKEKDTLGTFFNTFIREVKEDGTVLTVNPPIDGKVHPVDTCGTSCVLIRRDVIESAPNPVFQFIYNEKGTDHKFSEDVNFCLRAKERGFNVLAHTGVMCQHYKEIMLN